jgi:hypothetical protein
MVKMEKKQVLRRVTMARWTEVECLVNLGFERIRVIANLKCMTGLIRLLSGWVCKLLVDDS